MDSLEPTGWEGYCSANALDWFLRHCLKYLLSWASCMAKRKITITAVVVDVLVMVLTWCVCVGFEEAV